MQVPPEEGAVVSGERGPGGGGTNQPPPPMGTRGASYLAASARQLSSGDRRR